MIDQLYANPLITVLFFDFLRLILSLIALVLGFRIILRVEKKLDLVFKFLVLGFFIIFVRHLLRIFINLEIIESNNWFNLLELLPSLCIIIAFAIMNNLINKLERKD